MKRMLLALLLFVISFWSFKPILVNGFFPMHDDTQVGRVVAMGRALRNGQFPVRWVSDLGYGYGYPIFNFYGPLPYYFGGALYAVGLSGLVATKLMIIAGILFAGFSMYLLGSMLFGSVGGLLAATAYVYAPYHGVQLYVRGAVGEYWATIFFPLILYGVVLVLKRRIKTGVLLTAFGYSGVILSHTLLGYVTIFIALISVLAGVVLTKIKHVGYSLLWPNVFAIILALGITSFFWLPAFFEKNYTNVDAQIGNSASYRDHFVCINQLWDSPWGYGGSAKGCEDGMSFKLGKIPLLLTIASFFIVTMSRNVSIRKKYFFILLLLGLSLSVFFTLDASLAVWRIIPNFTYLQYPWRFLAFAIVPLALLSSFFTVNNNRFRFLGVFAILVIVVTHVKFFLPQYVYFKEPADFESDKELHYRVSKISDEYLSKGIKIPQREEEVPKAPLIISGDAQVGTDINTEMYDKFTITTSAPRQIAINKAYFPGWVYYVNGKNTYPVVIDGLPRIEIGEGLTTLELRLQNTPVRLVGNIISALTCISIVTVYGYNKKIVS